MQLIALVQEGSDSDEGPAWMEDEEEEESLAQVAVPSQKDIEEMLIRRRKKVGGSLRYISCPLLAMHKVCMHCIVCCMSKVSHLEIALFLFKRIYKCTKTTI